IRDRNVTGVQTCALPILAYKRQDNQKKRRVWLRVIYIVLAVLLISVVGAVIYGYNFVHKSLPIVEGEVTLPVKEEVIVETDEHGVPHIKRSEEHTSELQSRFDLVCRLLLEKKKR